MTDIQNKRGDIFFKSDKVIIWIILKQNLVQLFFTGIWAIYGTLSIYRSLKTGDQFCSGQVCLLE
jgi:hypothetical protein